MSIITIDPALAVTTVPVIRPHQARLWLLSKGKTDANVRALIASIQDPTARETAEIMWDFAPEYHYDNPFIVQLWAGLQIATDRETAFREAAAL